MSHWITKHAKLVIVVLFALSAVAAWKAKDVGRDMDFINYLPVGDPDVDYFKSVQAKFGINYTVMAIVDSGQSVFDASFLQKGKQLQQAFDKVDGIGEVMSLFNALDVRKTQEGMEVGELMPEIPGNRLQMVRLQQRVEGNERLAGVLVSKDSRYMVYLIRMKEAAPKDIVSRNLINTAEKIFDADNLYFAGVPIVMLTTAEMTESGMSRLIPLVMLVMIGILIFGFRSLRGVVLPLLVVGMALSMTMGLMTITGVKMTMISSILPVVLIAVGSAYAIHILNRYGMVALEGGTPMEVATRTLQEMWLPVFLASFTTVFGFMSLVTASLSPIREFGVFTAIGTAIALALALCILPAFLALLKVHPIGQKLLKEEEKEGQAMARLGRWVFAHSGLVVGMALLLLLGSVALIPQIDREMNMLSFFPEDSKVRRSDKLMKEELGGSQAFVVSLEAKDVLDPVNLHLVLGLEKKLRALDHVNNPQSVADLMTDMYDVMNGVAALPDTPGGVESLWFLLDGKSALDSLIVRDRSQMVIQSQLDEMRSSVTDKMRVIMEKEVEEISGQWHDTAAAELTAEQMQRFRKTRSRRMRSWVQADTTDLLGKKVPVQVFEEPENRWNVDNIPLREFVPAMLGVIRTFWEENEMEPVAGVDVVAAALTKLSYPVGATALNTALGRAVAKDFFEDDEELGQLAANLVLQVNLRMRSIAALQAANRLVTAIGAPAGGDLHQRFAQDLYLLTAQHLPTRDLPGRVVNMAPRLAGYPFIMAKNDKRLLSGQLRSIAMALAFVLLLMMIQLRSVVLGLLAIVPIANTVVILFGTMSLFGIVLDTGTAMIAAITIGIGIDYTIHVINRFRIDFKQTGSLELAIPATLEKVGGAVLLNALSVGLGFLVLAGSEMIPMRFFGILMCLGMLLSSVGALTLFPALMKIVKPRALKG